MTPLRFPSVDTLLAAEPSRGFADINLVHVVRQYHPMIGGLEDFVRHLVARQRGRFRSLRIITLDRSFRYPGHKLPKEELIDGVAVHRIRYFGSSRYPVAPAVFRSLEDADLIHVHAVDFFFDALAIAKPFHRKKLVATTHGGFFHTEQNAGLKKLWLRAITRQTSRMYDGIACCSKNDLAIFEPLAPSKVRLIENGVDLSKFNAASSAVPVKRIVTIGRFSSNKRLDRTLDALQYLVRSDPDWQLEIIGSASDLSASDVEGLAEARGVGGHVRLHLGISDEAAREVLSGCSVFVSASEYEGFGIALIEALSAGLIPIVHANPAFRALAQRHSMVHLADFADPAKAAGLIVLAMAGLAEDPSSRSVAISSANQHSWSTAIGQYDQFYRDALTTVA